MTLLQFDIKCPHCHFTIHIPFIRELEDKAIADYNLAEADSQTKLSDLKFWLNNAGILEMIKYWWEKRRRNR